MTRASLSLGALALALAGCAATLPALPSQGGPAWTELTSAHFTLWTDASAARGRELIAQLEHLHQIVHGVAFPDQPAGGRTLAFALRDRYEVGVFAPEIAIAYTMAGWNPALEPVIVFDAQTGNEDGHVLAHELTHAISFGVIKNQPIWFAEGIAQFFETTNLDSRQQDVDVGEPQPRVLQEVRRYQLLPGPAMFACVLVACRDQRFYMTTALLYSYLANERPEQLQRLQQELAAQNKNAWATALPDLPPERIDQALRAWLATGQHRVWHFRVALQSDTVRERKLGDGDVLAARALLHSSSRSRELATDTAKAIAADPTNLLARLMELAMNQRITPADAHATMAAHEDDWRAWLLVVHAGAPGQERDAALAQLCTLAAADPAAMVPPKLCAK